MMETVEFRQ